MISLKFLAWYFLGMYAFGVILISMRENGVLFCFKMESVCCSDIKIQSVTHDSIEDARTAIKLYHKYQEMSDKGKSK